MHCTFNIVFKIASLCTFYFGVVKKLIISMIRNSEKYSWLVSVISYHRYIERAHAGVISDFTFDLSVRTESQSGFNTPYWWRPSPSADLEPTQTNTPATGTQRLRSAQNPSRERQILDTEFPLKSICHDIQMNIACKLQAHVSVAYSQTWGRSLSLCTHACSPDRPAEPPLNRGKPRRPQPRKTPPRTRSLLRDGLQELCDCKERCCSPPQLLV